MDETPWTLRVHDFHALAHVDWTPSGVCLLAGANGVGKTTILKSFRFLRTLYLRGMAAALREVGGARALRRLTAETDAPVVFVLERGELQWEIRLPIEGAGMNEFYGETLKRGADVCFRAGSYQADWFLGTEQRAREERCGLRVLFDKEEPDWLRPFVESLRAIRVYDSLDVEAVSRPVSGEETNVYLNPKGRNLVPVLRNWAAAPTKYRDQFAWVLAGVRRAFPELIESIEFEGDVALIYPPGVRTEGIPLHLAADGLLTGLLHLTAAAGAQPGSLIAIDEMENQLHPHAIRSVLHSLRELAEQRGLTVVLTTHSPVVMNEFKGQEESFYVLESNPLEAQPRTLTVVRDPEWLAHFALGDLYEREQFAAQHKPAPA